MQKTQVRHPVLLDIGRFEARETVLYCPVCTDLPPVGSEELAAAVGAHRTFGYDVMAFVGQAGFRACHTADETVELLAGRNVAISESEVRELSARFIVSLGVAHARAAGRMRKQLHDAGGYILHLDSTCKAGSGHLLTAIDEISGLVLFNAKVAGESEDEVAGLLGTLSARYGLPAAISCDMSRGILAAAAAVLPDVPVFICHFHFLRDIGRDLMQEHYQIIRGRLRHHGVKAELKRLQRAVRDSTVTHAVDIETLLDTAAAGERAACPQCPDLPHSAVIGALLTSAIEAEHTGDGCGFPFDRPHFRFFRQLQSVLEAAQALHDYARPEPVARKLYERLIRTLKPVCADRPLCAAADALDNNARLFDRLRTAMRIAEPGSSNGLNDDGTDLPLSTIEQSVDRFCAELRAQPKLAADTAVLRMLHQIDTYRAKLFADPIQVQTPAGTRTLHPQRTNNICERFFRRLARLTCKRTGQELGAAALDHMLPDTPLVANLDNPRYLELLLDGRANIAELFADLDQKLINDTLEEQRRPANGLPRNVRARLRARPAPLQIAILVLANVAQSNGILRS